MNLAIHRGSHEIGGSCIEQRSDGASLLLDMGVPLVQEDGSRFDNRELKRPVHQLLKSGLLPPIPGLYGDGPCDVAGILVTHSHMDHYGLGAFVRPDVPIYMSPGTAAMLDVSKVFLPAPCYIDRPILIEDPFKPFSIGPFTITA